VPQHGGAAAGCVGEERAVGAVRDQELLMNRVVAEAVDAGVRGVVGETQQW
jgi:hypothetical protein